MARAISVMSLCAVVALCTHLSAAPRAAELVCDDLDEVVVTATRTPKPLKDTPVVTRLITGEEIKKSDATNIRDLLTEELPGLEFGYSMSQETSLYMGGFGGNAILFLIDGERLAGETLDNIDYNRLNLDDIGHVEIVKGASSALYGANAVGGVVNLISRQNDAPWHASVGTRYRSEGHEWRIGGNVGFNIKQWSSSTSAQFVRSSLVRLADIFDSQSSLHHIYGGRSVNVRERLTYRPTASLSLMARGSYYERSSDRLTYEDRYKDYAAGLRALWDISGSGNLELSYSYDQYDKSRYVGGHRTHAHDYSNRQNIVHALYSNSRRTSTLTAGADFMHDYLTSYQFTDNSIHRQYSVDAFVQFDWRPLSWLNIVASIREDYFSGSRSQSPTARLALMFKPEFMTIRASYAGGFRAPSLKEMYMDFDMAGIQMVYGNPDLKPEKSHNFSVSAERSGVVGQSPLAGSYNVSAVANYTYYNSRITPVGFDGDADREAGMIYVNENDVRTFGVDLTARYRLNCGVGAKVGYSLLLTHGRKFDSAFSQPRRHSANWRLDYEHRFSGNYKLYAGISGRYLGAPDTDLPNSGAYSLWKLTFNQEVWKGITVTLAVDNLFDYRPKIYYWNSAPTTGIGWQAGVQYNF